MTTEALLVILAVTVVLSFIVPALFPVAMIVNTISILIWLAGSGGDDGGSFDHYDHMGPGDSGGD